VSGDPRGGLPRLGKVPVAMLGASRARVRHVAIRSSCEHNSSFSNGIGSDITANWRIECPADLGVLDRSRFAVIEYRMRPLGATKSVSGPNGLRQAWHDHCQC